jgi:hypothetical protein
MSAPDATTPAPDATTPAPDALAPADASAACIAARDALGPQWISPRDGRVACTVVVRLDFQTYRPLGYQALCGPVMHVASADVARGVAQTATGFAESRADPIAAAPDDEFVFFEPPADLGDVAAVSVDLGVAVFGATTVWAGRGEIVYPRTWRDAAELGSGCAPTGTIPRARIYAANPDAPEAQEVLRRAIDAIAQTAVPAALWQYGYVFSALVLPYARTEGAFDPSTAEVVVMVNAGWLE